MTLTLSLDAPKRPKRVVIIGANGFIGQTMHRHVLASNFLAVPITRSEIDLEHDTATEKLAARFNADDAVIIAAGVAPIKDATSLNRANVISQTICNALRMCPVKTVVNISSDAVFSNLHDNIDESFLRSPSTIYGVSHYTRELMLTNLPSDVKVTNIHPTLLFGMNNNKAGYGFDAFFRQASQNNSVQIFGDGNELRDYVWVEDIARLAMKCLLHRSSGSIIAASGVCLTFLEVAKIVATHFNVEITHRRTNIGNRHPKSRRFRNSSTFSCFKDFEYSHPHSVFNTILKKFSCLENKP